MDFKVYSKTSDFDLVFEWDDSINHCMVEYVDSDYTGDLNKSQWTIDYVFTLAKASVNWKFALQSIFALSTIETKYMVVRKVFRKPFGCKVYLENLELNKSIYIIVYYNSQST